MYHQTNRNYIALNIHLIWATKNREPYLEKNIRYPLLSHIKMEADLKNINIKIINGVEDHLHCLVGMKPTQSVSDIVKAIKGESSRWLNQEFLKDNFRWQDGYGAIAVSPQLVSKTIKYIAN